MKARTGDTCRLAFVHDWLTGMRGGEKVLETLCHRYPHADVFTMVRIPGTVSRAIEEHRPVSSLVSRLPGVARYYRLCLPLFPVVVEQFDVDDYDLVVSTSHCAVKSAVASGRTRHLCYCFTPMRYAWDQFDAYFGTHRMGLWSHVMKAALRRLARWDAGTSHRPDRYVSISQYVADRIARYYNRRSAVVHPPVDTEYFHPAPTPRGEFALVVSALVPYKRVDLAIEACRLADTPLVIVGQGPERARLEELGGSGVQFTGSLPDADIRDLYRRTSAVLLTGEEDFGLVPVEAQACGRPVIALGRGGAVETVVDGVTGFLVEDATPEAFAAALRKVRRQTFDAERIRSQALRFSTTAFLERIEQQIDDVLNASSEAVRW